MLKSKSVQRNETIRLVKWLSENPKIMYSLCDIEAESTPEECLEIIELLEKNEFYDMIFILLMRNRDNNIMDRAITKMVADKVIKEWKRVGTEQICQDIKQYIKDEIKINPSSQYSLQQKQN